MEFDPSHGQLTGIGANGRAMTESRSIVYLIGCLACLVCTCASAGEPTIELWYGENQRFGHLGGHPQRWVNILGSVQPAAAIRSLAFKLNGGKVRELSFHEDRKRIARDGDFNVELALDGLQDGPNTLVISATAQTGEVVHRNVSIQFEQKARGWPLPYTVDWSKVRRIDDVVQITDGKWELTPTGLRSVERYYDRAFSLGDSTWRDYEVSTTVTVHAVTAPKTGPNNTDVAHAAIALRWPGHDPDGAQPTVKWHPLGATAEFRLGGDLKECRWRSFDGRREFHRESNRRRELRFEKTYAMKHRVETLRNGAARYRAKLWPVDRPEPSEWDFERLEAEEDVSSGSALLLAHHSDVTFGNIYVTPIPKPNVVVVLTDDQGYFDVSCHGNGRIRTPNLDKFASEEIQFSRFYVSTVCAPTRASLMTGRYNFLTGVTGVFPGEHLMKTSETTIAEIFADHGYATGIFGKWHLGDNHPMRPMDQGFAESLVHLGGAIGLQVDLPENGYFNPTLIHNGREEKRSGYCADVFTDAAIDFIRAHRTRPFLAVLSFNTPHLPDTVDERYARPYLENGLSPKEANVYGMISNVDENFGRLVKALKEAGIWDRTIVVFLSDNGADFARTEKDNGRLRGDKGTPYEGGLRVPCFMRVPGAESSRRIEVPAAHIDLLPTLVDFCGLAPHASFDGRSLRPLLEDNAGEFTDRYLFFQWSRQSPLERYRGAAVIGKTLKLVQPNGGGFREVKEGIQFELYDLNKDESETRDLARQYRRTVGEMKSHYNAWYDRMQEGCRDYTPTVEFDPIRENPVRLSRYDMSRNRNHPSGWVWHISARKKLQASAELYFDQLYDGNIEVEVLSGSSRKQVRLRQRGHVAIIPVLDVGPSVSTIAAYRIDGTELIRPRFLVLKFSSQLK